MDRSFSACLLVETRAYNATIMASPLFLLTQEHRLNQFTEGRFNQRYLSITHIDQFNIESDRDLIRINIMGHAWATAFRASYIPAQSVPFLSPYLLL
jgi:hypothetical protein